MHQKSKGKLAFMVGLFMVGVFYGFFLWYKSIEQYIMNFYILSLTLSALTS